MSCSYFHHRISWSHLSLSLSIKSREIRDRRFFLCSHRHFPLRERWHPRRRKSRTAPPPPWNSWPCRASPAGGSWSRRPRSGCWPSPRRRPRSRWWSPATSPSSCSASSSELTTATPPLSGERKLNSEWSRLAHPFAIRCDERWRKDWLLMGDCVFQVLAGCGCGSVRLLIAVAGSASPCQSFRIESQELHLPVLAWFGNFLFAYYICYILFSFSSECEGYWACSKFRITTTILGSSSPWYFYSKALFFLNCSASIIHRQSGPNRGPRHDHQLLEHRLFLISIVSMILAHIGFRGTSIHIQYP